MSVPSLSIEDPTTLTVRLHEDGHWYIGAGISMAEGPYRRPDQVLAVASDLVGTMSSWKIQVLNVAGNIVATYSSEFVRARDLEFAAQDTAWPQLAQASGN